MWRSGARQALHIRCTRKMSMDMLLSVVYTGPGKSTTDGVLTERIASMTDLTTYNIWLAFW